MNYKIKIYFAADFHIAYSNLGVPAIKGITTTYYYAARPN